MNCKKCRELFVNALYDELSAEQKKLFDAHLQECGDCAREFRQMAATLKIMDQRAQAQPQAEFLETFWDKVVSQLDKDETAASSPAPSGKARKLSNVLTPQWGYRIAAAAAILILGIFLGKFVFGPAAPDSQAPPPFAITEEPLTPQQTELDSRARIYLERSKVLLMGLNNLEPETMESSAIDFTRYQHLSRNLVQEAGYLKNALESDPRQRRLRELVSDLEVILLQIANLEAENDVSGIELVKSGVDRRGILLKINLEEIRRAEKNGVQVL